MIGRQGHSPEQLTNYDLQAVQGQPQAAARALAKNKKCGRWIFCVLVRRQQCAFAQANHFAATPLKLKSWRNPYQ